MARLDETGIVEGLGQLVTYWDPMTDKHLVSIEDVRQLMQDKQWCYVHDVPPTSDEERATIDAGDIDALCIFAVRVS